MFRRFFGSEKPAYSSPAEFDLAPQEAPSKSRLLPAQWSPNQGSQFPEPKSNYNSSSQSSFSVPRKPVGGGIVELIRPVDYDRHGAYQYVESGAVQVPPQGFNVRASLLKTWWLEIISCVLLLGSFLAVVATLQPYEGRPLPRWPYRLSINALISVYIVILKGSMLLVTAEGLSQLKWRWFDQERPLKDLLTYDHASRGPWGSLTLLWRLRGRQFASSCGAFITVAALIIDPFTQQVVDTYECRLPATEGIAKIPRSNSFDEPGKHIGAALSTISLPFQNALNAGVFNPGRSVNFDCSTGNCTFPEEYHTVGFCSQCNDTTNKISINTGIDDNNGTTYNITLDTSTNSYKTNLTAHLENNYNNVDYMLVDTSGQSTNMIVTYVLGEKSPSCPKTCSSLTEDKFDECNENWDLAKFGCTVLPMGSVPGSMEPNPAVGATSCSLRPCVRTYTSTVKAGRLQEKLLSTYDDWGPGGTSIYPSIVNLKCLDDKERSLLKSSGYDLSSTSNPSWLAFNSSLNSSAPDTSVPVDSGTIPAKCVYQIGAINTMSIGYFLGSFLNGSITAGNYAYDYVGPMALQAIFLEGNVTLERVDQVWQNMSDAITWYMRQNGDVHFSAPVLGEAWQSQTCVHIRWLFLIYPAVLVLLAIVFFGIMILDTRRSPSSRHDWKSSPLALLFHGLDWRSVQNSAGFAQVTEHRDMREIADQTRVRLTQTGSGWQFAGSGR